MNEELSILIYSCWKNRDMWEVFSTLFKKYWNDCIFSVVLVTDEYHDSDKEYVFTDVIIKDDNWAKMIKYGMAQVNTPYVMLFMDDYLLCDYVQNEEILDKIKIIKETKAINLRLVEASECKGKYGNFDNIGYYQIGEAYSLSTQVGIWDACSLSKIINDEWSAWDFERKASMIKVPEMDGPILVTLDYIFPYEEGVRQGKWMIQGERLCKRNNIKIDTQIRPIMTNKDMAKIYVKGAIIDWNPNLILKIQNFVNNVLNKHK